MTQWSTTRGYFTSSVRGQSLERCNWLPAGCGAVACALDVLGKDDGVALEAHTVDLAVGSNHLDNHKVHAHLSQQEPLERRDVGEVHPPAGGIERHTTVVVAAGD